MSFTFKIPFSLSGLLVFCMPLLLSAEVETRPQLSVEQIEYWDGVINGLNKNQPIKDAGDRRFVAYVNIAQKIFKDALNRSTNSSEGSFDPITIYVIRLFYPDFTDENGASDEASERLTAQLAPIIEKRFREEQQKMSPVQLQLSQDSWEGEYPYIGLGIPNSLPWILRSPSEFRLPPPPPASDRAFWNDQLMQVKKYMKNASDKEKELVLYWAGEGPAGSGDCISIIGQYMKEKNVPLDKRLEVRAKVAAAMSDAVIAAYDSKYTYLVKRPFMIDDDFKAMIDTPNHPSYPSAHSTVCTAAGVVMTHYFPEDTKKWQELAEEAGMSRLWGGIHFPIDHEAGKALGAKVGKAALERSIH